MKKLLIVAACLIAALGAYAAPFPDLYLRGSFNGWSAPEEYRFSHNAQGVYSLHVDRLDGEFKIADADWGEHIYGDVSGQSVDHTGSYTLTFQQGYNTFNFAASGLENVTLSFTYVENSDLTLSVTAGNSVPGPTSGTLPVLYINVYTDSSHTAFNNEVIDKDLAHKNYFSDAVYWLDLNGCDFIEGAESVGSEEEPLPLEIKARGNWTRIGFAKKPFKLKLGKKQPLLGLSKSKHFAILAHADDGYGYLRNFVGFNLGKRIGLPWTPSQQPVEVVINGDYRGLYFLTESIRVEEDRVNIAELDDNVSDAALVSGGYLVELDNYQEENQIRMPEKSCVSNQALDELRITFDTPEEYSALQRRFVTDQFTAMNDAVGDCSARLWSYLDMDDAARYYLVEEIVSHTESYHGSTYLFRDRGEGQKWHFSPLWDFGNAFSGRDDDFFYNCDPFGNTWIPSIRCNAAFNDRVRDTWVWFMQNRYDGLVADIDAYVNAIAEAAVADRRRWKNASHPQGGADVVDNSDMRARRNTVIKRLENKINWLCSQFGDYTALPAASEPERDTTPAAPLPEYVGSGIGDIFGDATDAPAEYYDIYGRRLLTPAPGTLVIERRGSRSRKIIF